VVSLLTPACCRPRQPALESRHKYHPNVAELWTCRSCHRRFANVNQWHSCVEMALEEHLASKSELAVALYQAVESALTACGDFRIHPQKTRVAFIARMTFAGVQLAKRWVDLSFILPAPLEDIRVREIQLYGPTSFGHRVRLTDPGEVDTDVRAWLCDARTRGDQETLDPTAHVEEVVGRALERLLAPLRTRVVANQDGLALAVPKHVAQAFGAHPYVLARIRGDYYPGDIRIVEGQPRLVLADALERVGLGLGDEADAYLKADL